MDYESVKVPKNIYEKVSRMVSQNRGLFDDESDYITHCIIHYNRNRSS